MTFLRTDFIAEPRGFAFAFCAAPSSLSPAPRLSRATAHRRAPLRSEETRAALHGDQMRRACGALEAQQPHHRMSGRTPPSRCGAAGPNFAYLKLFPPGVTIIRQVWPAASHNMVWSSLKVPLHAVYVHILRGKCTSMVGAALTQASTHSTRARAHFPGKLLSLSRRHRRLGHACRCTMCHVHCSMSIAPCSMLHVPMLHWRSEYTRLPRRRRTCDSRASATSPKRSSHPPQRCAQSDPTG